MKYINIGKIMCSLFVCIPGLMQAQTGVQYKTDESRDSVRKLKVAFREVDKRDLLGGVSSVNISELLKKSYSFNSLENLDAFAPGFHGNIWGNNSYLVLVDGIPRDASSVLPTEIEEITVLKSAAAVVLYGSRAAKGAVLITTKRGEAGKQRVSVRANAGVNLAKAFPEYLGSAEYMSLYNEALRNDGIAAKYTEEDIYNYAAGRNPYRYPSIDFYSSEFLKRAYNRYDGTLEVTGGNDRAKYYTNVGFYREGSFLNFGEGKDNYNQRFNVRGNVDVNITRAISSFVDASISFANQRGANAEYFSNAASIRPNAFTPLIPISMIDERDAAGQGYVASSSNLIGGQYLLGGTSLNQTNPIAGIYAGGSGNNTNRQLQFSTGVKADLNSVLKGLSFKTVFGLDYLTSYRLSFDNTYATYEPIWTNDGGVDIISGFKTPYGLDASTRTQNTTNNSFRQTSFLSAQLNYENQFADKHNVSALLVAGGFQQAQTGQYHKVASANLGMNLGYNFKHTYYLDFSGAVIHSARLPEANRQAFSPTVSAAWRLSNENFLKSSAIVDELRLLASAGIVHTDLDLTSTDISGGYYLYEDALRQTGDGTVYYTWKDGLTNTSVAQDRAANPNLRFPKRSEITLGIDGALFGRKVLFNGSYFISKMEGLAVQNTAVYPSYFTQGYPKASFIPYENVNDDQRTGFDLGFNYIQKAGQVDLNFGLTGTYYETKILKRDEPIYNQNEGYRYRVTRPLDNIFGLENLGFFRDAADIAGSPNQTVLGGTPKPGDLKYKDQNGDGIINTDDEVYLGRGGWYGSPLTLGANITAKYKNFTLFAVGMLRNGGIAMRNNSYFWVAGEDKYSEMVRGRWTEATAESATYPRLTTQNRNNNFRSSDFWVYSTNRFDLARVQLSYTFSGNRIKQNSLLNGLHIYAQGTNLLTIAKNREILELNVGSNPQTRFFNLGVKTSF